MYLFVCGQYCGAAFQILVNNSDAGVAIAAQAKKKVWPSLPQD